MSKGKSQSDILDDFYTMADIARFEGITVDTLENRICARKDHPPFVGRGKHRRFPKDLFHRWAKNRLQHEESKAS